MSILGGVYRPDEGAVPMNNTNILASRTIVLTLVAALALCASRPLQSQQSPTPSDSIDVSDSSLPRATGGQPGNGKEADFTGATFYLDQDSFLRHVTDQFYTMGGMFSRSGDWVVREHLDRPLNFVDSKLRIHSLIEHLEGGESNDISYESHSVQGGISAFTPQKGFHVVNGVRVYGDSLADTRPHPKDRPYACLTYMESARTMARGRNAFTTTLTAGILGTGLCRTVQSFIHENFTNDVKPGGWHHQISPYGEPTLKYRVAYTGLLFALGGAKNKGVSYDEAGTHWLELTVDGELDAGFYTNASAGARVRAGLINSVFWGMARRPIDAVSLGVRQAMASTPTRKTYVRHFLFFEELYPWVSGGATGWAYNALMQGQFEHSHVRLSFNKADTSVATLRRSVTDVEWGLNARVGRVGLMYQHNRQSPEFSGPEKRPHAWGGIYLSFAAPGEHLDKKADAAPANH
jgi:outer membrane protein LpxR